MGYKLCIPLWSIGLWQCKTISWILQQPTSIIVWPIKKNKYLCLGWGAKKSAQRATCYAKLTANKAIYLEDGFLRSWGPGKRFPPISLVIDELGIYYDSTKPSTIEATLNSDDDLIGNHLDAVLQAKSCILSHELSKYNHANSRGIKVINSECNILVVDQTRGDMSVSLGGATDRTFRVMLESAYLENPDATIYVKTHPEVTSGKKKGYLSEIKNDSRTVVLRQAMNPLELIKRMDRVYVVSSTMGFEALLAGKPVTCFGVPWYAGWGVTDDRQPCPRRIRHRSVNELFYAAYFMYAHYLNPATHQKGNIFDAMNWLIHQRQINTRFRGRLICAGFRRWKAANIKPMLALDPGRVIFENDINKIRQLEVSNDDMLVYWGCNAPDGLCELVEKSGATFVRMEDGFIRSVGLGSDLIRPLSLVLDASGIYFDPRTESDLEKILSNDQFSNNELAQANRVRELIVKHGITKYNLEPLKYPSWESNGKKIVLVPGQVEDDASIKYGCSDIKTNIGLLRAARESCSDAYIVYKPHPDVMSGNRKGRLNEAYQYADYIETNLSVVSCIDASDEIHTMTSLSGFDALLRGKKVVVYGQPFYAGWGLTDDVLENGAALRRRQRKLSLDELVAGALLRYPIYWDWELNGYTTCEAVILKIVKTRAELEAKGRLKSLRVGYMRRQLRKLKVLLKTAISNL